MKLFWMLALGSLTSISCTSGSDKGQGSANPISTNISAAVYSADGLSLTSSVEGFEAQISCENIAEVISLTESQTSATLFGDDLSECSVELLNYTASGILHDLSQPGYQVTPSKSVSLSAYTPGDDISISFSVNQIIEDETEVIITDFTTTTVTVGVDLAQAPDYDITGASVVVLDPFTLGLKIDYNCSDCDLVKIAIADNPQTEIDETFLNSIHSSTVSAIEGEEISSAGSVTYKLSDIGLTANTLDSADLIFSLRREGEDSFKYVNILSADNALIECGVLDQEEDYTGGKLLSSEGFECNKYLGTLKIVDTQLTTLTDLSSLVSIHHILIANNTELENLNGLENVEELGTINVSGNPKIVSISQFSKVTEMESLLLSFSDELIDISGFANVETVSQDVAISFMKKLTDLSPLSKLKSVGDDISIQYMDELLSLNGLQNLENVKDVLVLFENTKLNDITALSKLSGSIEGTLSISFNYALQSLSGLDNLQSARRVDISYNPALIDISALSGLNVEENLTIVLNELLTEITSVVDTMTVGQNINIAENGTAVN